MAFPDDYKWMFVHTVKASEVDGSGSHTDFPVQILLADAPVSMMDAGAESCLNGGGDIRAGNVAGTVQYALEVVRCVTNATLGTRELELHVKVPSLSTSVDTEIGIFYDNTGDTQPAADSTYGSESVWDADFEVVSHNGGATNSVDSSSGTEIGTMSTRAGPSQGQEAADFGTHEANNAWKHSSLTAPSALTMEAYVYIDGSVEEEEHFVCLVSTTSVDDVIALNTYNNTGGAAVWTQNNPFNPEYLNTGDPAADEWMAVACIQDGSDEREIFQNGVSKGSDNPTSGMPASMTDFIIGYAGDFTNNLEGGINEVRTSSARRADGWITTTQNMLADHANFSDAVGSAVLVDPPTLTQSDFRIYDDGTEAGAVASQAQNVDDTRPAEETFHIRFGIEATGDPDAQTFTLEYEKDGEGYGDI